MQTEGDTLAAEDLELRGRGWPQRMIYRLRVAGYNAGAIRGLPIPSYDELGFVKEEYWQELINLNVPRTVLDFMFPSISSAGGAATRTAIGSGADTGFDDVRAYARQAAGAINFATVPTGDPAADTFSDRFGSPVRRMPSLNSPIPTGAAITPLPIGITPRGPGGSPLGGQPLPATPNTAAAYLQALPYAIAVDDWPSTRQLLFSRNITVYYAFGVDDKQFECLLSSMKVPASMWYVGAKDFDPEAWRDLREFLEVIDVWHMFCAMYSGNMRVVLDAKASITLDARAMTEALERMSKLRMLGHSDVTTALTQWHYTNVQENRSVLYASLASVVFRDRLLRRYLLQGINDKAKAHVRSSFPRDDGMFVMYAVVLHSWRFKEAEIWTQLFKLDAQLSSKKPKGTTVRDWRKDMDTWRASRRALANGVDIDSGHELLWLMRVLETHSEELWYEQYRRDLARDESRGRYIDSIETLWEQLEFEETYADRWGSVSSSAASRRVSNVECRDVSDECEAAPSEPEPKRQCIEDLCPSGDVFAVRNRGRFGAGTLKGDRAKGDGKGGGKGDKGDRGNGGKGPRAKGDMRTPGASVWSNIGYAHEHPNPKPNDASWRCRTCGENPCIGFCFDCLQTCHPSHRPRGSCPYVTGAKVVSSWDWTRPCIKCREPAATHQPWNCPSKATVAIRYRQYAPKILVDYGRRSAGRARVSNVEAVGDAEEVHEPEQSWQGQDDGPYSEADADQMAICNYVSDNPILDFASDLGASIMPSSSQALSSIGVQPSVNNVSADPVALQIETNSKALDKSIAHVMEMYRQRGAHVGATFYVSFVDENKRPLGAMMLDSGAQINIENDITCFVDYLKPSDVRISLADKKAMLKNCGFGTRRRLFRDVDGNVYVYTDQAYYCPDAAYPIMSTGEWEDRDATITFNPGARFRATAAGKQLPPNGKACLIIDAQERMLMLQKIEGVKRLWWLVPIQPSTLDDVDNKRFISRNRDFVANLLTQLNSAADGPTVEDYASKVQTLQQQLEEAHMMHSQLYGASQEDIKYLIASAHESIMHAATHASRADRTGYRVVDSASRMLPVDPQHVHDVCSRCRERGHSSGTCTMACCVCLSATGHEQWCDVANHTSATTVRAVDDHTISALRDDSHSVLEAYEDAGVDRPSDRLDSNLRQLHEYTNNARIERETGVPPSAPASAARADPSSVDNIVTQQCASLEIVQQGVRHVLDSHPNVNIATAVRDVICSLAQHERDSGGQVASMSCHAWCAHTMD